MKINRIIYLFILFIIFIFTLIVYDFYKKNNFKNIINKIELQNKVEIEITKKPEWGFFPKISLNFISKIKDNYNQFASKHINFSFIQKYKLLPLDFVAYTDSFSIKGLEIKLIKLNGNYRVFNKIIHIKNIEGKIGRGKFNTKANINLSENNKIKIQGSLENLYLNQILRQLDLANWNRLDIRLSSDKFEISSLINSKYDFINNLNGSIPINGSIYFITTEEEKFGVSLLNLLVEKLLPDYKNVSTSLSQIISNYSDKPVMFEGTLDINDGIINTSNLSVINNNNRINIDGNYDILNNYFNTTLFFIESKKIIVEAKIKGDLQNPKIQIINDNQVFDNEKINNDLNKIFGEGINTLIDKLLKLNE